MGRGEALSLGNISVWWRGVGGGGRLWLLGCDPTSKFFRRGSYGYSYGYFIAIPMATQHIYLWDGERHGV